MNPELRKLQSLPQRLELSLEKLFAILACDSELLTPVESVGLNMWVGYSCFLEKRNKFHRP